MNRRMTCIVLQKFGWSFACAESGERALEHIERDDFDLILMDCQMPDMDGFETTRRIRASQKDGDRRVPVIAFTANALQGDREACLAAEMDDFLPKPFKAAQAGRDPGALAPTSARATRPDRSPAEH